MNPFDLMDQATITSIVREATDLILNNSDRVAPQFAQNTPTELMKIAKARVKLKAVGKARGVLAEDATPPIYRPEMRVTEEAFSMFIMGEQTPVEPSLRRQLELNGTDAESISLRDRAGVDIVTRVRAIAVRNENLTDWMTMQAVLNGQLEVKVANPPGQTAMDSYYIDYEYPTGAITQAPTSFDNTGSGKPVDVLRAAQQQVKNTSGRYGTKFTMSSELMNLILTHPDTVARISFTTTVTEYRQVTQELLKNLLWDPDNVEFNVTDAGWFDETAGYGSSPQGYLDSDKTRWVPKDTFICQATGRSATSSAGQGLRGAPQPAPDGTPDPDPFMSLYDGKVFVPTSWNDGEFRGPGPQTYKLMAKNGTIFYHWMAARFPMIHHPERICVVKAVF
jgi:hypothetical protein